MRGSRNSRTKKLTGHRRRQRIVDTEGHLGGNCRGEPNEDSTEGWGRRINGEAAQVFKRKVSQWGVGPRLVTVDAGRQFVGGSRCIP